MMQMHEFSKPHENKGNETKSIILRAPWEQNAKSSTLISLFVPVIPIRISSRLFFLFYADLTKIERTFYAKFSFSFVSKFFFVWHLRDWLKRYFRVAEKFIFLILFKSTFSHSIKLFPSLIYLTTAHANKIKDGMKLN